MVKCYSNIYNYKLNVELKALDRIMPMQPLLTHRPLCPTWYMEKLRGMKWMKRCQECCWQKTWDKLNRTWEDLLLSSNSW